MNLITDLPDAILNLILSKLSTKSVITTSSVSKRWREISAEYLTYANNFDFGDDFGKKQTPDMLTETINKILSIHKSDKIDSFNLVFSPRNQHHKSNAVNWIDFATSKGVREIELDFCRQIHIHFLWRDRIVNNEAFELPTCLFDCTTLKSVKLRRCILALPETYLGFSGITTLYLKDVHVTDDILEKVVINCTYLEVLVLKECGSLSRIRVKSAVNLRRLTVYECYNASTVEISGPNIRSLLISCGHLEDCRLENMGLLEDVFVGTRGDEFGGVLYIFKNVLSDIAHVRVLTLYLGHLVPSLFKDFKVDFVNLEELILVNSPLFGLFNTDVYCFFKHCSCPSLKKITIQLSTVSEEDNFVWEYRKPNFEPTECTFYNLRDVTLLNYRDTNSDIDLANYFFKNSPNLESMLLVTPRIANVSCSISKGDGNFEGMEKGLCDMLLYRSKTSSYANVRILSESDECKRLLSILKWYHVSDVYYK
ncbi:hypothetical protein RND81_07G141600 [Saponaria officinalis]|uniref:F-box domain-containing protein n=1 Tax=Saponaria officinalis TaxID=3572 RepID=A0AAW1JQ94_SAPOF